VIVRPLEPFQEVKLISPDVHTDARGAFVETYQAERYRAAGFGVQFVQDNLSRSKANVLRGLHFQHPRGQAKLVRVACGAVWDAVVDVRRGSPSFGKWAGIELSGEAQRQLYIPAGFAHGFVVLTETAVFEYKCSETYRPEFDRCLAWNDPDVGIAWPIDRPRVSERDEAAPLLSELLVGDSLPEFAG
jgi:dTDP-4-dehydrorhamnose 3,5-epimerase